MVGIPPGSPVRRGVKELIDRCQAYIGLTVKRAQRPVLRHVSRSMDLRSVRNRNRRQTPARTSALPPSSPPPLAPASGSKGSQAVGGFATSEFSKLIGQPFSDLYTFITSQSPQIPELPFCCQSTMPRLEPPEIPKYYSTELLFVS
jgi:hypothetical protein